MPGEMSDEQIVRVLAEFMGFRNVKWDADNDSDGEGVGYWTANPPDCDGDGWDRLDDFVGSYDALAPVWRKLAVEIRNAPDEIATKMSRCLGHVWVRSWYDLDPKQHALALARAIAAGKEWT